MKKTLIAHFIFLAMGASVLLGQNFQKVKTDVVIQAEDSKTLVFTAPLRARERTTLSFSVPARMKRRYVQIGEQVSKGQVLAELNNQTYDHALKAADAELLRLEIQIKQSEKDLNRVAELFASNAATKEENELYKTKLNALESGMKMAEAQKAEARHLLNETKLKAPFDASVAEILLEEGEFASPGKPVFLLAGKNLEMEIRVTESILSGIQPGDQVEISFPLLRRPSITGTIHRIGLASFSANLLFPVIIHMEPSSGLIPGLTAEARLQLKSQSKILVPLSAIINPSGNQPNLLAVINSKIRIIPIQIHQISGKHVAISGAIEPGTEIVIAGHSGLLEGDQVEVIK